MARKKQTPNTYSFSPEVEVAAKRSDIAMPSVIIDPLVTEKLVARDQTLRIKEDALLSGLKAIDIGKQITVNLNGDAIRSVFDHKTTTYDIPKNNLCIRLANNPEQRIKSADKVDYWLWLGMLVCKDMYSGNLQLRNKQVSRQKDLSMLPILAIGSTPIWLNDAIEGTTHIDPGVTGTIASIWGSIGLAYYVGKKLYDRLPDTGIEKSELMHCRQAADMANSYPVFEYQPTH